MSSLYSETELGGLTGTFLYFFRAVASIAPKSEKHRAGSLSGALVLWCPPDLTPDCRQPDQGGYVPTATPRGRVPVLVSYQKEQSCANARVPGLTTDRCPFRSGAERRKAFNVQGASLA